MSRIEERTNARSITRSAAETSPLWGGEEKQEEEEEEEEEKGRESLKGK